MKDFFITLIACAITTATVKADQPWIAGNWVDSSGNLIEVRQTGTSVRATMHGKDGKQYWHVGDATIDANGAIEMNHFKDGAVTDTQKGRVNANRSLIEWGNQSAWSRTSSVDGFWLDTSRNYIEVDQSGYHLKAGMLTGAGKRHWTAAVGTVDDNGKIVLQHKKNGTFTESQTGELKADHIEWSNKSKWFRIPTIRGQWKDGAGKNVEITQNGRDVEVTMQSTGNVSWTRAEGTVNLDGSINLVHLKGSQLTDRQVGKIQIHGSVIKWGNQSVWKRR